MLQRCLLTFCLILLPLAVVNARTGDETPAWLQQAAQKATPPYPIKDIPALILHQEEVNTVDGNGKVTTTKTFAVRFLLREGRSMAVAAASYNVKSGKVKEIKGWLLRAAGGTVKKYGKDETADIAFSNDVYEETRTKIISASSEADAGDVFGYQIVSERQSVFSQDIWEFQSGFFSNDALPTLVSRFSLNLPEGWRAQSVTFNHSEIKPSVNGTSYTWELQNLPPHPPEPLSPPTTSFVPRIAVSYFTEANSKAGIKTFANWNDVATWLSDLEDPQMTVDDPLASKARELTANAKTDLEKIQAIGRYAQSIQYISIQTNVAQGGGLIPHSATQVFAKSYGDCKDKANLMRAMLSVLKIKSYMVSIYSGDPSFVRAEWASPQQFNHCIIAIKISDETIVPAIINHPQLGRLLIFDPTDDTTPVGDLPWYHQGSLALIDAKATTELSQMPTTLPEVNRLEREAEVELGGDGSLQGKLRELSRGHSATQERSIFRNASRPDYNKIIESWLADGLGGVKVSKIDPQDFQSEGRFSLEVEFAASRYGQLMQGRLLIFKPALVSRRDSVPLSNLNRLRPVQLRARAFTETVRVKLPAGFVVDETPDKVQMDTNFGSYVANYEVKEGYLIFTRRLVQQAITVPAAQYAAVRGFYARIREAEQNPVVLVRK